MLKHPISNVKWVPLEKVVANDYNPNSVPKRELKLLYISILHDGYTQPVVTVYNKEQDQYVIVDGFHRYLIPKMFPDIYGSTGGKLPVVVIEKDINDRMASTVRHNRARGKHSVEGMSNLVFNMLDNGWTDEEVCNQLGMEAEEIVRLKYVTGFAKLFENAEYSKAWKTKRQLKIEREYNEN